MPYSYKGGMYVPMGSVLLEEDFFIDMCCTRPSRCHALEVFLADQERWTGWTLQRHEHRRINHAKLELAFSCKQLLKKERRSKPLELSFTA